METVKIGWGRRDLTMEGPVCIPGQMHVRLSRGIMDPLYATALCVDGGEGQKAVIFCSLDLITLGKNIVKETARRCKERHPEMPADAIILNATHTHSSIDYWSEEVVTPDGKKAITGPAVYEHVVGNIVDACCEAWTSRKPGGIAYGYGFAVAGNSRRVCYMNDRSLNPDPMSSAVDGFAAMYGNTRKDDFSHYEAGSDHFLNAMYTFDENDKLTGMLLNVPCPSQAAGGLEVLSADYWHNVREMAKVEFGEDIKIVTQCAAAGDMAPRILHYIKAQRRRMQLKYGMEYDPANCSNYLSSDYINKTTAERMDIAERIVQGAKEIYQWAKKDIRHTVAVDHESKVLELERRKVTQKEVDDSLRALEYLEDFDPVTPDMDEDQARARLSRKKSIMNRHRRTIKRFEEQAENPYHSMLTHVCRIGDIAFATNQFELYIDYMHRMQARSPFLQTFVVQMAGTEGSGYLATKRGVENKGYSASIHCGTVGYEGGQQLVEETLAILNEMKAKDEA